MQVLEANFMAFRMLWVKGSELVQVLVWTPK